MATYTLPHFGPLDPDELDEYYDVEIDHDGKKLDLDLNFELTNVDVSRIALVKDFIEKIGELDKKNKKYIEEDYADEKADTVKTYLHQHLEDISREELSELVDFEDKSVTPEKQLMKALHLVRIGFYPEESGQFAVFDYSIGRDLTNYLVVININDKSKLDYMTMES